MMVLVVWMGYGIHAPGMPGVTANHTPECQPAASQKPVGFQGLGPVLGGIDLVAIVCEATLQETQYLRIVVHYQNTHRLATCFPPPTVKSP